MIVVLARHGATPGNLERRYIGSGDEALCDAGRAALLGRRFPDVDRVFVSPLRRCRETADAVYPGVPQVMMEGLRETDFGRFEGHTYEELKNDADYQAWLDSAGCAAPPGGESREKVRQRVVGAFEKIMRDSEGVERIALVVHGGTIMTLMEAFEEKHLFYDWQVPNGGGWICRWEDGQFWDVKKLE